MLLYENIQRIGEGDLLEEDVELGLALALELHLLLEHLAHPVRVGARALAPRRRLRDVLALARRDRFQERSVLLLYRDHRT